MVHAIVYVDGDVNNDVSIDFDANDGDIRDVDGDGKWW